jgi:hypothetical protein
VLLLSAVSIGIAAQPAAADEPQLVLIDTVAGNILDVTPDRILFLDKTVAPGLLKIEDRTSGVISLLPAPPDGRIPFLGFLAPRGAIFVALVSSGSGNDAHVFEWTEGSGLADLDATNSPTSLAVAGRYAIWNSNPSCCVTPTPLLRRDLLSDVTVQVSPDAANWKNSVAANGDVAYWTDRGAHPYEIFLYHDGASQQLTNDGGSSTLANRFPFTDGSGVVGFSKHTSTPCYGGGSLDETIMSVNGVETVLSSWCPGIDPGIRTLSGIVAGGWLAFNKPDGTIALRAADGSITDVSASGRNTIIGLSPRGQVAYCSDSTTLRLASVDGPPLSNHVPICDFVAHGFGGRFVLWQDSGWLVVRGGGRVYSYSTSFDPPGTPTIGTAAPADGSAIVTFAPPTTDAGPITAFRATCRSSDGGVSGSGSGPSSPIVVSGLTNGRRYTCTAAARNTTGVGPESAATNAILVGLPTAPTGVHAIGAVTRATVVWTAPASDGGSPIERYVVTAYRGSVAEATRVFAPTAPTAVITGLSNGVLYSFRVAAVNTHGAGIVSAVMTPIRVGGPMPPTPPRNVVAVPGDGQAALQWAAPARNGSASISGYIVTPYLAGVAQPVQRFNDATSQVVTGLANGQAYTFRVTAVNVPGVGLSSRSGATSPIVVGAPTAPTSVHAYRIAPGRLFVTFVAGSANGAPISRYVAHCTSVDQGVAKSGAGTPTVVSGLSPGKRYRCAVHATNSRGAGPASDPSNLVIA